MAHARSLKSDVVLDTGQIFRQYLNEGTYRSGLTNQAFVNINWGYYFDNDLGR